jgi:hypothetical protein
MMRIRMLIGVRLITLVLVRILIFYLMRIRIRIRHFNMMRMRIWIQILALKPVKNADADPGYQNDADPYGSGSTTLLLP